MFTSAGVKSSDTVWPRLYRNLLTWRSSRDADWRSKTSPDAAGRGDTWRSRRRVVSPGMTRIGVGWQGETWQSRYVEGSLGEIRRDVAGQGGRGEVWFGGTSPDKAVKL